MHFTTAALFALLGSVSAQKVHVVSVSNANNSLAFFPDNLKADVGDMIQFQFRNGNHSVVQSNFDNPCSPIAEHTNMTGIFSGYQNVKASLAQGKIPLYTVMVTAKTPTWYYCSQGMHCQNGMVMVVNENTAANASRSLDAFKALAKAQTANVAPPSAFGGVATNETTSTGGNSGSSSGTPTSGSDSSESSSATSSSSTAILTAAAHAVGVSSTLGLVGVVAALFML
ncbi:hypothetical protein F4677DRAFT_189255 [Hypoxylon crocopeplum]|nr:hypothetical protein F4677DRAFT_189255 [Hypoxylon crocopeplum]